MDWRWGESGHNYCFWSQRIGQNRVELKSMKDLVLVKKDMLQYVQDLRTVKGIG